MIRACLVALLALSAWGTQAKIFDPSNDENIAAYVRGTFGESLVQKEAFIHSDGDTPVSDSANYNLGGEIGFLARLNDIAAFRVGAEILAPQPVTSAKGMSGGTQLFSLDSQIFIFNPQVATEITILKTQTARLLLMMGVGYATVDLKNSYTMTSAGQSQLGVGSFTETATAHDINEWAGVGYEFQFVDRMTMMAEASYRNFKVPSLDNSQAQTTIAQPNGSVNGAQLVNMDGSARKFDMSGVFVGISFRFFLQ